MTEKQLYNKILANKDRYFCWASRPATVQRASLLVRAWHQHFKTSTIILWGWGDDASYYFEKDKFEKFGLELARECHSPFFIKKHLVRYQRVSSELLKVGYSSRKLKGDHKTLLSIFNSYRVALCNFAYFFITPFYVDDFIYPTVAKKLERVLSPHDYQEAIHVMSSPTAVFEYQKYQLRLIKARTGTDIERIVSDYRWLREYSFKEKLLDKEDVIREMHQIKKANLENEIKSIPANCRLNQRRLRALVQKVNNKGLGRQIEFVNDYVNIKTGRIEVYKMFQADFRNFFYRMYDLIQTQLPLSRYEDIISLTDEEIIAYLERGKLPDLRITAKRFSDRCVSISFGGPLYFIYNLRMAEKIRRELQHNEQIGTLKGKAVSQGVITGRVKIVTRIDDLKLFNTGQVLVANFTTPEYIPAMKKAAAIITDDGGITSHAAVISRELKKPCVVGTKIATKVFNDGDRVEVDATRGIVKKL